MKSCRARARGRPPYPEWLQQWSLPYRFRSGIIVGGVSDCSTSVRIIIAAAYSLGTRNRQPGGRGLVDFLSRAVLHLLWYVPHPHARVTLLTVRVFYAARMS